MVQLLSSQCAVCGGNLITDEDMGPRCLLCGRGLTAPRVAAEDPEPEPRTPCASAQTVARLLEELELDEQVEEVQVDGDRRCACGCGRSLPDEAHELRRYYDVGCRVRACMARRRVKAWL